MSKALMFLGATVGSAIGWWIGARVGIMTAFVVSMVVTRPARVVPSVTTRAAWSGLKNRSAGEHEDDGPDLGLRGGVGQGLG